MMQQAMNQYQDDTVDQISSTELNDTIRPAPLFGCRKRLPDFTTHDSNEKRPKKSVATTVPTKRTGHAMCAIGRDTAVLIGGETNSSDHDSRVHNDDSFYQLKLVENRSVQWTKVALEKEKQKRVGHQIVHDCENRMISIVGGFAYH
eukprot:m.145798 g.145798  ORF g.145798 m.145798 type:complete len:147 (+) comp38432_c1_seq25:37-477(+)